VAKKSVYDGLWKHVTSPKNVKADIPWRRGNAELRVRGRRQIADAAVWPNGVVVVLPNRQSLPGRD
jgi:hypothetical protein